MTAPFPYDAVAGRGSLANQAAAIYGHYAWLARWSEEIAADPDIDLKKVAQLCLIHCRMFRQLVNSFGVKGVDAIENVFRQRGISWATKAAMTADLTAVRDEAQLLFVWVRDNMPEARDAVKVVYDETNTAGVEQVNTVAKPHAVEVEIAKLRALFGAVPTA